MDKRKIFPTWLVNVFLIILFLVIFLRHANIGTWFLFISIFSLCALFSLFILRSIFKRSHYQLVRFIITFVLTFLTSVVATALSFMFLPNDGYTLSRIIESSIGIAMVVNIALFWCWGIVALINFIIFSTKTAKFRKST